MIRTVALALTLVPALAFASVGKVTAVEGQAWRTHAKSDAKEMLAVGTPIEQDDTLQTGDTAKLKIALDDGSEFALGPDSILDLQEAVFHGEDRSFLGMLRVGKMLTWVKKKLSGPKSKFEVGTERAVAGVRGTIFGVEVTPMVAHAFPPKNKTTRVSVTKGKVAVSAGPPGKAGRHQVAGPQQITPHEWEKRFVLLQKGQMVEIGDAGWKQSKYDPKADDDLRKFLNAGE